MPERQVARCGLILAGLVLASTLTILYRGSNPSRITGTQPLGGAERQHSVHGIRVASAGR